MSLYLFHETECLPDSLREYITSQPEQATLAVQGESRTGFAWSSDRLEARLETHRHALDEYPDGILICNAEGDFIVRWCNQRFRWWRHTIDSRVEILHEYRAKTANTSVLPGGNELDGALNDGLDDLSSGDLGNSLSDFLEDSVEDDPTSSLEEERQSMNLPEGKSPLPMPDPYGPIPKVAYPDLRGEPFLNILPLTGVRQGRFSLADTARPVEIVQEMFHKTLEEYQRLLQSGGDDSSDHTLIRELILETEDGRRLRLRVQPFHGRNRFLLFITLRDETGERNIDEIQRNGELLEEFAEELVSRRGYLSSEERERILRNEVVKQTRSLLEYRYFWMRKFDPCTGYLVLKLDDPRQTHGKPLKLRTGMNGNGIAGVVAATGESYLCLNTISDQNYHSWREWDIHGGVKKASPQTPGEEDNANVLYAKSCIVVPMKRHGELFGTINIESEHENAFNESDVFALEIYARYLASAMNTLARADAAQERMTTKMLERFHRDIIPLASNAERTLKSAFQDLTTLTDQLRSLPSSVPPSVGELPVDVPQNVPHAVPNSVPNSVGCGVGEPTHGVGDLPAHMSAIAATIQTLREEIANARGQINYARGRLFMTGGDSDCINTDKPTLFIAHQDQRIMGQLLLEGFGDRYRLVWAGPGRDAVDMLRRVMAQWAERSEEQTRGETRRESETDDPRDRSSLGSRRFREPLKLEKDWERGLWFGPQFLVLTGVFSTDGVEQVTPKGLPVEQKSYWLVDQVREMVNEFAPKFYPAGFSKYTSIAAPCPDQWRPPNKIFKYPVPVFQLIACIHGSRDDDHVQIRANQEGAAGCVGIDLSPGVKLPITNVAHLRESLQDSFAILPFATE